MGDDRILQVDDAGVRYRRDRASVAECAGNARILVNAGVSCTLAGVGRASAHE